MTEPVHIDEAIGKMYHVRMEPPCGGFEEFVAIWAANDALEAVRNGQVFTDDRLRADRMTRALAGCTPDLLMPERSEFGNWACCGFLSHYSHDAELADHADDCAWIEARRWVDANPEVVA